MQIQINSDVTVRAPESFAEELRATFTRGMGRFGQHITRLEVHLSTDQATPQTLQCLIEARLQSRQPVTVTAHAPTLGQAAKAATEKLLHLLDSSQGRLNSHRTHLLDVD